jgi:hypothetical protein
MSITYVLRHPKDAYSLYYTQFLCFRENNCFTLRNALVKSKLEYASVVWNNLALNNSHKTDNTQTKFANLCHQCLLQFDALHNDDFILKRLILEQSIPDNILMLYFLLMFARQNK